MKKKALSLLLALGLCALCAGCTQPDALTLDLSHGYGQHTKLIHLNASSSQKAQRLEGFYQVLEDAEPLDKEFSLFTYYPDYLLETASISTSTTRARSSSTAPTPPRRNSGSWCIRIEGVKMPRRLKNRPGIFVISWHFMGQG